MIGLGWKFHKIQELIRQEQTERDKDADECLLLAFLADKQRLKVHFKKKKEIRITNTHVATEVGRLPKNTTGVESSGSSTASLRSA